MRRRRDVLRALCGGLSIAALLSGAPARAADGSCAFPAPPTVVVDDGRRLLEYWVVPDSPVWESGLMPDSTDYWRFVQYVRARVDVSDPRRYVSAPALPTEPDKANARLMLAGGTGEIRPIACLEALLLGMQAKRRPMETRPTEFLAFILRRDEGGEKRLKVWSYTVDQPGIGRLGPLRDAAEADVSAGWAPWMNLHNHNFFFDKAPVAVGVPWPSASDAEVMKDLRLGDIPFETTAVTDGFFTSRLRPGEVGRFAGPETKAQ